MCPGIRGGRGQGGGRGKSGGSLWSRPTPARCLLAFLSFPRRYLVIFQNYFTDLETVQKLYEKNKYEPPIPRNAPPVAGNIMWARQLLRRIEHPMQKFSQNKSLMATKESKKIVKT